MLENMEVNATIHENKQLYAKEETPGWLRICLQGVWRASWAYTGEKDQNTVGHMKIDVGLKSVLKSLHVYMDVMYVDGKMFMVSMAEPLNLMLQSKVENKTR